MSRRIRHNGSHIDFFTQTANSTGSLGRVPRATITPITGGGSSSRRGDVGEPERQRPVLLPAVTTMSAVRAPCLAVTAVFTVDRLTVTAVVATPPTVTTASALKFKPVMVIGVPPSVVPLTGLIDDTVSVVGWVGEPQEPTATDAARTTRILKRRTKLFYPTRRPQAVCRWEPPRR